MVKQFDTSARRGVSMIEDAEDLTFMWGDVEMVAHPPSSGQLALFMAGQAGGSTALGHAQRIRAIFDFLASVLDQSAYDIVEQDLHEGVDVEVVIEVVEYLVEEWSARPTSPPRDSSPSRRTTGTRSTATRRGKGSTSGTSRSTAG